MKKLIITYLSITVIMYLSFAFLALEVNPFDWSYDSRSEFTVVNLYFLFLILLHQLMFNTNKN